jgi:glycolate dehydrogenase iron-sulfur subunit
MTPLDHCLGCLACETACPSGVVYGDILVDARRLADRGGHVRHPLERFLLRHVMVRPDRLRVLVFVYRAFGVQRFLAFLAKVPLFPNRWRERWNLAPRLEPRVAVPSHGVSSASGPRAILLMGCAARVVMPSTLEAMAVLLERAGYRVERAEEPTCCGALAHHAGLSDLAHRLATDTVERLAGETDAILVPTAAGCGAHLRSIGAVLADRDVVTARMGARVRDLSQALLEAPRPLSFHPARVGERVVFQDPCHLRHAQGIVAEPRRLLEAAGATLLETEEADLCCGSAGSYHLAAPELSAPLARKKRQALLATGAATVVTANPGCWLQLRAVWPKEGPMLTTLARFLAERLAEPGTSGLPPTPSVPDHS